MKRLILAIGIGAAAMAVSTPVSAQTGCRWYDVTCRLATGGTSTGRVDTSWHIVGHDANGNAIYERRRVDGNGNVVVERARRDALGRMVIIDRDIDNRNVQNSTRYGVNGEACKYRENERGYKTQCRYDRNGNLIVTRGPSERYGALGTENCKFQSSDRGYKEQCKYVKNKTNGVYGTNKVKSGKYNRANVNGGKPGKAKGHNKH